MDAFIARIKEVNPLLNAVVADRFEDARKEAAELDRILDSDSLPEDLSEHNAPYLGVPFTTKEAISVAGNVGCQKFSPLLYLIHVDADAIHCIVIVRLSDRRAPALYKSAVTVTRVPFSETQTLDN